MSTIIEPPLQFYTDDDGDPLEGGYIFIGEAGLNPESNPIAVYADDELTIPMAQPIRTISGYPVISGRATRIYSSVIDYSILTKSKEGELVHSLLSNSAPEINGFATVAEMKLAVISRGAFASTRGYSTVGDGGHALYLKASPTSVDGLSDHLAVDGDALLLQNTADLNIKQCSAVGDGVTNNDASLASAKTKSATPYVPDGDYLVTSGTDLSGYWGEGTVSNGVTTVSLRTSADLVPTKSRTPVNPVIYDMHFDALKGVPWDGVGGTVTYTISAPASAGDFSIEVSGTTPIVGELLAYKAIDGEWYTACVDSVVSTTVNLKGPLEANIDATSTLSNFYNNSSHPNFNGKEAIVDYMLRHKMRSYRRVSKSSPAGYGSGVVTVNNTIDPYSPGGTNVDAWDVTSPGANDGCEFTFEPVSSGSFLARIKINTAGEEVEILTAWASVWSTTTTYNDSTASVVEIPMWIPNQIETGTMSIIVRKAAGGATFIVSDIEILEFTGTSIDDLDHGTHVLFGDSWFAQVGMYERFLERLPNATIINEGIGGHKASDLSARFDTDVTPHNPDYVWIMAGTNDYFSGASVDLHGYFMTKLKQETQYIGATPIVITSSVGEIGVPANYNRSREYLDEVLYWDSVKGGVAEVEVVQVLLPISVYVPAGATVAVASLGRYVDDLIVYESYLTVGATLSVDEGVNLPAATNIGTIGTGYDGSDRNFTPSALRYLQLNYTAVAATNVQGYLLISPPVDG